MQPAIGVDLGGTHLRAARVDPREPSACSEAKVELGSDTSPGEVARRIAEIVRQVEDGGAALPVGIGVAGMLRGDTGVVENAPNLGWRAVDLRALVAALLPGRQIELHNDVNAIAFGEYTFGAGRGAHDLLCVFVGTGVGGGLVVNGRLVKGASHVAGEIGHVKVVTGPLARPCGCGGRGCIEAYVGGLKLQTRARAELRRGASSSAVALAGGDPDNVHPGHLDEAARSGDAYASALWDEVAPLFALVLANAVTLLNPGRLILGGGVWSGAPDLRRRVLAAYRAIGNVPSIEACTVLEATLGDLAGILGAASLATIDRTTAA